MDWQPTNRKPNLAKSGLTKEKLQQHHTKQTSAKTDNQNNQIKDNYLSLQ
jgi:hypothetical protein